METRTKIEDRNTNKNINTNTNKNINTNNLNIKVEVEHKQNSDALKKSGPNWYIRTILGGLIALALSLCGYYVKNNSYGKSKVSTSIEQNSHPIKPNN